MDICDMKILITILLTITINSILRCQIWEDFSGGNIQSVNYWVGSEYDFMINSSNELQLNMSNAGSSYLCSQIQYNLSDTLVWDYWYRLGFAPSNNNLIRLYLFANKMNLEASDLRAIYLEIGENGSNDAIKLKQQIGNIHTIIGTGTAGQVALPQYPKRIRVIREPAGLFSISIDTLGNQVYKHDFNATLLDTTTYHFMGFWCKYTSTNSNKIFFDDIGFSSYQPDYKKPKITSLSILSSFKIRLRFNEPIKLSSIQNQSIQIANGDLFTQIQSNANLQDFDISFPNTWSYGDELNFIVKGIEDTAGNVIKDTILQRFFHPPHPYDFTINEILADPTPTIGLPNTEYIEIYNTRNYSIDSKHYKICIKDQCEVMGDRKLNPGEYGLIIPKNFEADFPGLQTLLLNTLPSLANEGSTISIRDSNNQIIDQVSYKKVWYKDPIKADGGFSLERINPKEFCLTEDYFMDSKSYTGGTPGYANSILNTSSIPLRFRFYLKNENQMLLIFNKKLNPNDWYIQNIQLQNNPYFITNLISLSFDSILIEFDSPIPENTESTFTLQYNGRDCSGMWISVDTAFSFINYKPNYGDLIITEIMAAPSKDAPYPFEYIEIYNRHTTRLALNDFSFTSSSGTFPFPISSIDPGEHFVFTNQPNPPSPFINCKLPALNNDLGEYGLVYKNEIPIHRVQYQKKYFADAQKQGGGYSLELQDYQSVCTQTNNWRESLHENGGTPGTINSRSNILPPEPNLSLVYRGIEQDSIYLYFNKNQPYTHLKNSKIHINNNEIPGDWLPQSQHSQQAIFKVQGILPYGETLEIKGLRECETEEINTLSIQLPKHKFSAQKGIRINEILFYAKADGAKYVEFINTNDSSINIQNMYLGKYDTLNNLYISGGKIWDKNLWLLPGEIICFTLDKQSVINAHISTSPNHIFEIKAIDFPSSTGSFLAIENENKKPLDFVHVDPKYHTSFLSNKQGVSLERLNLSSDALSSSYWTSASTLSGYGTPGSMNSQSTITFQTTEILDIQQRVFSPDMDGYEDILKIASQLPEPGMLINIRIVNEYGQIVKTIIRNEIAGKEMTYIWDGSMENGTKAPIGIYKIILDGYDSSGKPIKDSKTVVLALNR